MPASLRQRTPSRRDARETASEAPTSAFAARPTAGSAAAEEYVGIEERAMMTVVAKLSLDWVPVPLIPEFDLPSDDESARLRAVEFQAAGFPGVA